jgi:hypothetical protein
MGAPFLANSQAGVLYPLNWPLAWLAAPQAVKVSLVAHLIIAAVGAFMLARRALGQSNLAAGLAAALFSLGGYVTAQVEHVNQLQGLAWLPWLVLAAHVLVERLAERPIALRRGLPSALALAVVLALQILAGHTQTAFISLAGALVYAATLAITLPHPPAPKLAFRALWPILLIVLAAVVAALLAAAQVLPTLELSSQSLRGGGLPLREALSFSLDPRLLGRALLPGYSRALFSEFVAYLGVAGLALAVLGLQRRPERLALAATATVGLGFALGAYDPAYTLLASFPPFNLFRAPARWLALFGFGAALLAGHGLDELANPTRQRKAAMLAAPLVLVALTPLAARLTPAGETGPLGLPQMLDLAGWLAPLALLALLVWLPPRATWRAPLAASLAVAELFAASWALPYNHLTTPEAYASVRPAMTQLLANLPATSAGPPAARFLSMSALRFDPGDLAELQGELGPQLPGDAVYDAVIATKNKEVLSPNLPLAWDVPAVDGYDGGILPLRRYAAFTQLFTGAPSEDGRLRENLTTVPVARLLGLMNVRYLITDKVDDAWVNGVFYDLQFTLTLAAGQSATIAYVPAFRATALGVVAGADSGQAVITTTDGNNYPLPITNNLIILPAPAIPAHIGLVGPLAIRGLSLVDTRTGAFQSLALGPVRLVHSGDVKVYENEANLPRAFVAPSSVVIPDDARARAALADPAFDPASTAILADGAAPNRAAPGAQAAVITEYSPERVRISVQGPGTLVLTDAFYPGWTATVDGAPATIERADILFRAVALPAGHHEVEFDYSPQSVWVGMAVSAVMWVGALGSLILLILKSLALKNPRVSPAPTGCS